MKIGFIAILAIILAGCATGAPVKYQTQDPRGCAQNLTIAGNLITGQMFKTHQSIPGVTKSQAIERAAKAVALAGMSVVNSDKDLGIISASKGVVMGEGSTAPMNITVESTNTGVDVGIALSIEPGQFTSSEQVKNVFCKIMETIGKKN
jgi:hypothetical protein